MITCAECGTTYEAEAPSRHLAPCGIVCLMASMMQSDGTTILRGEVSLLPSEMHCPPMKVGGSNGTFLMPGRCPKGCYGRDSWGNSLPPPAPADYLTPAHALPAANVGACHGAGQRPTATRWRAALGGYAYGRRVEGSCPVCGQWLQVAPWDHT